MLAKLKKILQRILGVRAVRKMVRTTNVVIFGAASWNRITSIIFNWIIFWPFSREQHAFLKGRYHFYRSLNKDTVSKSTLRRNIHRLEKAMTFRPRRDIFALDFIGQTVEIYAMRASQYAAKQNPSGQDLSELEWAHDVLERYFSVIKHNKFSQRMENKFKAVAFVPEDTSTTKAPFLRSDSPANPIKYEDLLTLSMRRRSVRWYLQKKVPRELIDKALLIARQSPTACNRLPFEYRIYDDPDLVKKVASTPMGTAGYAHNIPVIVVLVGKLNYFFSSRDRHSIYTDASLSAMAFMYALETLGLASGPINWPDFEPLEYKMQKLLKLAVDERPIMLISVGYGDPKGYVAFSQKKSLDALRNYNTLGPGVYK